MLLRPAIFSTRFKIVQMDVGYKNSLHPLTLSIAHERHAGCIFRCQNVVTFPQIHLGSYKLTETFLSYLPECKCFQVQYSFFSQCRTDLRMSAFLKIQWSILILMAHIIILGIYFDAGSLLHCHNVHTCQHSRATCAQACFCELPSSEP